jgi:predicted NAD-dependent protein-ADP-ribosyltransferase YbiA (DUF1768 family)
MNEETIDQEQAGVPQEQTSEVQSEKTSETTADNLFELPDGRKVDASTLSKEWKENFYPEFTRRSQKLAEIERANRETETRNKKTAEESISQNKLLEDVDPSVRDAIVQIVSPVIQEALSKKDKEAELKQSNAAFEKRLDDLTKKYPGGNGLKKFDKIEILREMQKPTNEIYDPEVLYQRLNWDSFLDYQIKTAMKGKASDVTTEDTSVESPKKPGETGKPSSWSEASRRAASRI